MLPVELQLDWERQQAELASRVVARDDAPWLQHPGGWQGELTLVAGLDISFFPAAAVAAADAGGQAPLAEPAPAAAAAREAGTATADPGSAPPQLQLQQHQGQGQGPQEAAERAVAALAVLTFPALQLRHLEVAEVALGVPYLPGFLGFREVPAYLELLHRAAAAGVHPQLLLVDGFGALHPRRCGSASHLGVLSGLPSVGVAKRLLQVDGLQLNQKQARAAAADALAAAQGAAAAAAAVGEPPPAGAGSSEGGGGGASSSPRGSSSRSGSHTAASSPAAAAGSAAPIAFCAWLPLEGGGGEVLGAALCGAGGSSRPVFVSAGHRVSLATAVDIVQRCCRHRVPEPIRQADLLSRAEVRRLLQQQQQDGSTSSSPQLQDQHHTAAAAAAAAGVAPADDLPADAPLESPAGCPMGSPLRARSSCGSLSPSPASGHLPVGP